MMDRTHPDSTPVTLPTKNYRCERLVNAIKDAIYANAVGVSLTEVLGALEISKIEMYKEQKE